MKILMLTMFIIISLSSNSLKSKVDTKMGIIQLGVFKDIKNVQKLKKKFTDLNLYVQKLDSGINKVFIINIEENNLIQTLQSIRTSIPNAFVLSNARKGITFGNLKPCLATVPPKKAPEKEIVKTPVKSIITFEENSCLDSKAIIKTRKKFFK